ncbi:MAG: DUF4102 domain-containing protein [Proteobacteria bacterium]|nr:DUF4102 domain-containing protein [Pseudomonadota bacterium]
MPYPAAGANSIGGSCPWDALGSFRFWYVRSSPPRVRGERARLGVVRHPRRVSFGHSLYLLVTPKGGRLWHYRYRFQGREKLLSLGCYPDVPMDSARARQNAARQFLDLGVDPAERRAELRQISAEPA